MQNCNLKCKEPCTLLPYPKPRWLKSKMLFYKTRAQEHSNVSHILQTQKPMKSQKCSLTAKPTCWPCGHTLPLPLSSESYILHSLEMKLVKKLPFELQSQKTQLALEKKKKKKKNLEVWALLNTKNRVCSSVVNKSKMPLEQHARRWSVHLPGGTILLMRFSDLMSTILLKTKAPIFLNKMHSCGEDRKDLPAHPSVSH